MPTKNTSDRWILYRCSQNLWAWRKT